MRSSRDRFSFVHYRKPPPPTTPHQRETMAKMTKTMQDPSAWPTDMENSLIGNENRGFGVFSFFPHYFHTCVKHNEERQLCMVNRALYKSVFFRTCNTTIRFVSRKTDDSKSGVASMNSASRNLDNQLKTRRKVAKMLIAVVIMFSINFFPVHFLPVLQVLLCRGRHFWDREKY